MLVEKMDLQDRRCLRLSKLSGALAGVLLLAATPLFAQINPAFLARQDLFYVNRPPQFLEVQFYPQGSYLGVRLVDIDADRAATLKLSDPRGVEVTGVQPASPAAAADIKAGDVLLTYNGESILGAQHLGRLVAETPPGRKIRLQYWRDGKVGTTTVTTRPFALQSVPNLDLLMPDPGGARINEQLQSATGSMFDIPIPIVIWKNPVLGLWCEPIDLQLAEYFGVKRGVLVRYVEKDGVGQKAGLKAGDVLISIGKHDVTAPRDVTSYLRSQRPIGKSIVVEFVRDHKPLVVHVLVNEDQQ